MLSKNEMWYCIFTICDVPASARGLISKTSIISKYLVLIPQRIFARKAPSYIPKLRSVIPIYSRTFPDFTLSAAVLFAWVASQFYEGMRFLRTRLSSRDLLKCTTDLQATKSTFIEPNRRNSSFCNRRKDHLACKSLDSAVILIQIPLENEILGDVNGRVGQDVSFKI